MMPRLDPAAEAQRMRDHRQMFDLAQAAHVSLAEARRRMVEARWNMRDLQRGRCGTQAPPVVQPDQVEPPIDTSDEGLKWFQK